VINKVVKNYTKRINACVKTGASSQSHCQIVCYVVQIIICSYEVQTWCAVRSAHIPLLVHVIYDDMVMRKFQ